MSIQESSSIQPLVMQPESSESDQNLDAGKKAPGKLAGSARGDIQSIGVHSKKSAKLVSPIANYQTDRYRLASPHSLKI